MISTRLDLPFPSTVDVTQARTILANAAPGGCYQGQTHGHEGFLL